MSKIKLNELVKDCEKIWGDFLDTRFIRIVPDDSGEFLKLTRELDKRGIVYLVDTGKPIRANYSINFNEIELNY